MSDKMVFSSEDELRLAMNSEDKEYAKKVTDAIIRDNIEIKTEDAVEEVVEQEVHVEEPVVEEPKEDVAKILDEENKKLKELYEQMAADKLSAYEQKIKDMEDRLKAKEEAEEAAKRAAEEQRQIELDEEDEELASSYSRNTRKKLEAEIEMLKKRVETPEITEELRLIKERLEREDKEHQEREAKRIAEEKRKAVLSDLEKFSRGKPEYELPMDINEARNDQFKFKEAIARELNLTDAGEIEKAYRRVIRNDSAVSVEYRKKLEKAKIDIPEYSEKYLNLTEVYELRSGKKFNIVAGVYEPLELSLEDAYKLRNFNKILEKAGAKEAMEIQKKLDSIQNSAVTLSNSVVSDTTGGVSYNDEEILTAIKMDKTELIKNRLLASKYKKFLEDNRMSIPPVLNNI